MSELKQKGMVRAVGISCHDLGALKVAAEHPWVDVILARVNNVGREAAMDASVEEVVPVIKQARANGKVILGMKIFGASKLVQPEQKDASLRYVWQNNLVDAMTVGMLSPEQVDDTLQRANKALRAERAIYHSFYYSFKLGARRCGARLFNYCLSGVASGTRTWHFAASF